MSKFFPLKVADVIRETADTVAVVLDVPDEWANDFKYKQGQYLTFRMLAGGEEIRRSYSLCSSPFSGEKMCVAVKEVPNGKFSTFINRQLKAGDVLETMHPAGNFFTELSSSAKKHYAGFAAGSGVTPVMSILKSVLIHEPHSRFTLVYSNRNAASVIFYKELEELKNKYPERLEIIHVWSRQDTGNKNLNGRLDKNITSYILQQFGISGADEFFICGPEEMIMNVSETLKEKGIAGEKIHFELFTTPVLLPKGKTAEKKEEGGFSGESEVTVIMDGIKTTFKLSSTGTNVLDAAMDAGSDAPYSCKGAVCCTCKAKILEGKAEMEMNYALTDKEVADGYILTCQAHPRSPKLIVDYDQ
ncbi:MAG: 2Fe-2S iron-sulfur cluster-binding protein [Bacteroidota bacterium]